MSDTTHEQTEVVFPDGAVFNLDRPGMRITITSPTGETTGFPFPNTDALTLAWIEVLLK